MLHLDYIVSSRQRSVRHSQDVLYKESYHTGAPGDPSDFYTHTGALTLLTRLTINLIFESVYVRDL